MSVEQTEIRSWVQAVTPETAARWLEMKPTRQRKITRSHIDKLKVELAEGRMRVVPQAFIFEAETGGLMDGQHRCTAIVESGIGLDAAVVVAGVPSEMFANLDRGRGRSAHQFVDAAYSSLATTAARLIMVYRQDPEMVNLEGASKALHMEDVIREAETNESLRAVVAAASLTARASKVHGATLAAIAAIAYQDHSDKLDDWFAGIRTGAGLMQGDPRLTLRNHYISGAAKGDGKRVTWGKIAKAWNAYISGESRGNTKYRVSRVAGAGEAMPRIK